MLLDGFLRPCCSQPARCLYPFNQTVSRPSHLSAEKKRRAYSARIGAGHSNMVLYVRVKWYSSGDVHHQAACAIYNNAWANTANVLFYRGIRLRFEQLKRKSDKKSYTYRMKSSRLRRKGHDASCLNVLLIYSSTQ